MSNLRKGSMAIGSTVIIGFVIVSFMFTGYEGFTGSSDNIATVDGTPIKVDEFRNEYQRQMQFYSGFFGGKSLTQKQIKQFKVEEAALKNLISRKLVLNLADNADLGAGKKELAEFIKQQPYFQTNKEFDVNKYKALLRANNFTPSQYEALIANDIKVQKANTLFSNVFVPDTFVKELVGFKQNQLEISGVRIIKDSLQEFIPVSQTEIDAYVQNKDNEAKLKSLFDNKKSSFAKPEEVKASHILIKIENGKEDAALKRINELKKMATPANFAKLANNHTQDPSGKKKGGDLGWFARGRMVPEFEKVAFSAEIGKVSEPVKSKFGYHLILVKDKKKAYVPKIDIYKNQLAKELIQRDKKDEHQNLITEVADKVEAALNSGNVAELEQLRKKYKFEYKKSQMLGRIGTQGHTLGITNEMVGSLYEKFKGQPFVEKLDKPTFVTLVKANKMAKNNSISFDSEKKSQDSLTASRFRKEAIEVLEKNARIKKFAKF